MELLFSCIPPPWKKKRIPSPFPSRDRRRRRRRIPLLKISSSPLSTSSSSSRRVSFVMRESELEVGEEKREKENNKKTKKKRTKMSSFVRLTMDDKFSSSFDRRRRRRGQSPCGQIISLVVTSADVAIRRRSHCRIEGGADQFGVVILGRRNQLQCARRVASVHRHLHGNPPVIIL